jgi:hypothetical protein
MSDKEASGIDVAAIKRAQTAESIARIVMSKTESDIRDWREAGEPDGPDEATFLMERIKEAIVTLVTPKVPMDMLVLLISQGALGLGVTTDEIDKKLRDTVALFGFEVTP